MVAINFNAREHDPRNVTQKLKYTPHEIHYENGNGAQYVLEIAPQNNATAPIQLLRNTKIVAQDEPLPEQDVLWGWLSHARQQYQFSHELRLTYIVPVTAYSRYLEFQAAGYDYYDGPVPARGQIRLYTVQDDNQLVQRYPDSHVCGALEYCMAEHLIAAKKAHTGKILIDQLMRKKDMLDMAARIASHGVGGNSDMARPIADVEKDLRTQLGIILKKWRIGNRQQWNRPVGFFYEHVTRGPEWAPVPAIAYWITPCVKAASKAFANEAKKAATKQRAEAKRAEKKAAKFKPANTPPPVDATPQQAPTSLRPRTAFDEDLMRNFRAGAQYY